MGSVQQVYGLSYSSGWRDWRPSTAVHTLRLAHRRWRTRRRPCDTSAWIELGRSALRARQIPEAIRAADAAYDQACDGRAFLEIARIFEGAGAEERCVAAWRAATDVDPDAFEAFANLGMRAWRIGETSEAISALTRAVELRPTAPVERRVLVRALIEAERGADAVSAFREYARINDAEDQLLLARAWQVKGDGLHALIALQSAERVAPHRLDVCLELCACMWANGTPNEALILVDRMLARWPESAEIHINAATVHSEIGDVERALEALQTAERLRPELLVIRRNRAAILFEAGRYAEAVEVFREVVDHAPLDATAHMQLATALRFQHRRVEAQRELDRVIQLGNDVQREQAVTLRERIAGSPVVSAELELALGAGDADQSAMSGSLARLEVTQLLEFVRTNRWSGTVLLSSRRGVAELRAEDGQLLLACCSTLPTLRDRLIERGVNASLLVGRVDDDAPLAVALLDVGAITKTALLETIEAQIRAVIGELLAWKQGYFMLRHLPRSHGADSLLPAMNIEHLLLDAFRQADEARAELGAA